VTRRVTALVVAASVVAPACDVDDPGVRVDVVAVSSRPCDRPTSRSGWGTVVGRGHVLTAAHVVDGPVREVRAGDAPAVVLALDAPADLAIVAVAAADGPAPHPPRIATSERGDHVTILVGDREVPTVVERAVLLDVTDVTAGTTSRRASLVLRGALADGASGSPVVDASGALLGVVTLVDRDDAVTYATSAPHLVAAISLASAWVAAGSIDPVRSCAVLDRTDPPS
jgi:S1-C subfamily serine protease